MRLIKSLSDINLLEQDFPIFFGDKWLEQEKKNKGSFFLCYDDKYKSIIPFRLYNLKFLKKANYLFTPLNYKGEKLSADQEKSFIEEFHEYLKLNKICDVIFPPLHVCNFRSIPNEVYYFSLGIIKLDLGREESVIFNSMSSNYKNEIRKAIKSGVSTHFGEKHISDFYPLYKEVHLKQNLAYLDLSYFEDLLDRLPNNTHIGVSKFKFSFENAIFNIYDKNDAYYLYAGSRSKTALPGTNKLLLYEALKDYKKKGIKTLIMGGYRNLDLLDNKHVGIQKFKLRFGSEIQEGFHFIKIINPFKYQFFSLALKIKSIITGRDYSFINKSGLDIKVSK